MKILCYINKNSDGGAERVMSVLANGLSKLSHKVTMVTDYSTPGEYELLPSVERIVLDGEFTGATAKGRIRRTLRRIRTLREYADKAKMSMPSDFDLKAYKKNKKEYLLSYYMK